MMSKAVVIAGALVLSACSGFILEAEERVKGGADAAADATTAANCAMTYGAWTRRPANEKIGVKLICDPAALDDLRGLLER